MRHLNTTVSTYYIKLSEKLILYIILSQFVSRTVCTVHVQYVELDLKRNIGFCFFGKSFLRKAGQPNHKLFNNCYKTYFSFYLKKIFPEVNFIGLEE